MILTYIDDFSNLPSYSLLGNARNGCWAFGTECTGPASLYSVGRQLTPTSSTIAGPMIFNLVAGDPNYEAWAYRTSYVSNMYYYGNDSATSQFGTIYNNTEGTYVGYVSNDNARCTVTLTWDGTARTFGTNPDWTVINTAGLSPAVNLASGNATEISLWLVPHAVTGIYYKQGTVFTLEVWSNGGANTGSSTFTASADNTTVAELNFPLSLFPTVNFSSVSALRLTIQTVEDGAVYIASIVTIGSGVIAPVPLLVVDSFYAKKEHYYSMRAWDGTKNVYWGTYYPELTPVTTTPSASGALSNKTILGIFQ